MTWLGRIEVRCLKLIVRRKDAGHDQPRFEGVTWEWGTSRPHVPLQAGWRKTALEQADAMPSDSRLWSESTTAQLLCAACELISTEGISAHETGWACASVPWTLTPTP